MKRSVLAGAIVLITPPSLCAAELGRGLSISGIAAWGGQCQELSRERPGEAGGSDVCRGALPFQPRLSYRPTADDELFVKLGFAVGNARNDTQPFNLSPWAADLEDDVKNINGRGRNYLLTAWYRHDFRIAPDNRLSATLGLIDSTDFLDNNAFANDEYTQFMNEALVNSPQVFLPSYDLGAAVRWDLGPWSLRGVYMNVGKDEDEGEDAKVGRLTNRDISDDYNYFGAEIGYTARTGLGEGNFRVLYSRTSDDFLDPTGSRAEHRTALAISFDQELGNGLGAFVRVDAQSDEAAIDYDSLYSGGFDVRGNLWRRENDNIGLGIAYLNGGNLDIKSTRVAEAYYRFVLDDRLAITADVQYMREERRKGSSPRGYILGLRAAASF